MIQIIINLIIIVITLVFAVLHCLSKLPEQPDKASPTCEEVEETQKSQCGHIYKSHIYFIKIYSIILMLILIALIFAVGHSLSKPPIVVLSTCEMVQKPQGGKISKSAIEMASEDQPTVLAPVECYYYYADEPSCDDDSDKDYVIVFKFEKDIKRDNLEWTTSSERVRLTFSAVYGGLSVFGYNDQEVRLCIGEDGAFAAGGIENVIRNLKLVE